MKINHILILSILSISFSQLRIVSLEKRKMLVSKIKEYLNARRPVYGSASLINSITTSASISEETIPATSQGIEDFIKRKGYNYDQEFLKTLRAILYQSEPGIYNKISDTQGTIDTWHETIGCVLKENKEIYILYLRGTASGKKIIQQREVEVEKCRTIFFFFKKCEKYKEAVDRGFTMEEIQKIKDSLAYSATTRVKTEVNKIDLTK